VSLPCSASIITAMAVNAFASEAMFERPVSSVRASSGVDAIASR
jgi:hypothetical protein